MGLASTSSARAANRDQASALESTGILPYQELRSLVRDGAVGTDPAAALPEISADQIQPASIDLRLGPVVWRVQASFLAGPDRTVEEKLAAYGCETLDLRAGAVLERGQVYVVRLVETVALPSRIAGQANPKSSAGRLDVFTRLITDGGTGFDDVPAGYAGPLYAEISPRTFRIRVRQGSRLNQLRLRRGDFGIQPSESALRRLHDEVTLVQGGREINILRNRIAITIDLQGIERGGLVGFKARRDAGLIDYEAIAAYDPLDFWEPIHAGPRHGIVLNLDDFYILASKEAVTVPPDHAAELVAYDTMTGEFRVHYAGFFDPGFGLAEAGGSGSRAVLEVRPHEVPFMVEDGQIVGRLVYERLTRRADRLYGAGIGSTYQAQGLRLAKQFKTPLRL
jgi:dCTP deaminase